jgi:hypothetical protein
MFDAPYNIYKSILGEQFGQSLKPIRKSASTVTNLPHPILFFRTAATHGYPTGLDIRLSQAGE